MSRTMASPGNSSFLPADVSGQYLCEKAGATYGDINPYQLPFPLFLFQGVVMLTLSSLLHLLLKPLKQPLIVSQTLAGILLGPTGLKHNEKLFTMLFPPGVGTVPYTVSLIGVYYFLFVEGVKVDTATFPKLGRKVTCIAICGIIPYVVTMVFMCILLGNFLPGSIDPMFFIRFLALTYGLSFFPSLQPILAEFRLLNTELGRFSMNVSMVHLAIGAAVCMGNQVIAQGYKNPWNGVWHLISVIVLWLVLGFVFRPAMLWIIRRTPEGRQVDGNYVVIIILLVMVVAWISNVIGATVFQGVLIMALLVPPGPPLGSALVKKIEPIGRVLFFPIYFIVAGFRVDLFNSGDWKTWCVVEVILLTSWFAKLMGIISSAVYLKTPFYDAVALAFACSCKGLIDLVILAIWYNAKVIDGPILAILTITNIAMTCISTPILTALAERSKRQKWSCGARSIQQSGKNLELRIVACIHGHDDVPSLLSLLQVSHPTRLLPICLYVLHLVELVGRGAPIFKAHKAGKKSFGSTTFDHMMNAFHNLEKKSEGDLVVQPFISVSPHKTMHQDICTLADDKLASLLIIPFNSQHAQDRKLRLVVRNVLKEAPCSVGVLVDNSGLCRVPNWATSGQSTYHIGVVFLGGPHDREALCYVERMIEHPCVMVSALRCLASYDSGHDHDRIPDEIAIQDFKQRALHREGVHYTEEVVTNVETMVAAIRSMGTNFDLMMVGRSHEAHSMITNALSQWNSCEELGVIGDFLASPDFNRSGVPVLVMQHNKEVTVVRTNQVSPAEN